MEQNWNNLLSYIKRNLGVPINFLEISDEDIVSAIKEEIIPYFSQFSPYTKHVSIDSTNFTITKIGDQGWIYSIPSENNERIIDVLDVFYSDDETISVGDYYGHVNLDSTSMIDLVMLNTYNDMSQYLRSRNTWNFIPPKFISFDRELINPATIVYNTPHTTLETIRPDYYETIFKKLCLGRTQKWLLTLRSKYESITTPFGEIRLNIQRLETDSDRNIQEAEQLLELVPLDKFVEVCV